MCVVRSYLRLRDTLSKDCNSAPAHGPERAGIVRQVEQRATGFRRVSNHRDPARQVRAHDPFVDQAELRQVSLRDDDECTNCASRTFADFGGLKIFCAVLL
jgi:hypothetical protein